MRSRWKIPKEAKGVIKRLFRLSLGDSGGLSKPDSANNSGGSGLLNGLYGQLMDLVTVEFVDQSEDFALVCGKSVI